MNQKGITLLELLVVVVILGLLGLIGAIGITQLLDDTREDLVYTEANLIYHATDLTCIEGCQVSNGNNHIDITDKVINSGYYEGDAVIETVKKTPEGYRLTFTFNDYRYDSDINGEPVVMKEGD